MRIKSTRVKFMAMAAGLFLAASPVPFAHGEEPIIKISKAPPAAIVIALYETGEAYYSPIIPSLEFSVSIPEDCLPTDSVVYFKKSDYIPYDLFQPSRAAAPSSQEQPIKAVQQKGSYTFITKAMRLRARSYTLKKMRDGCQKQDWKGEIAGKTLTLMGGVNLRCQDDSSASGYTDHFIRTPETIRMAYKFKCQPSSSTTSPSNKTEAHSVPR